MLGVAHHLGWNLIWTRVLGFFTGMPMDSARAGWAHERGEHGGPSLFVLARLRVSLKDLPWPWQVMLFQELLAPFGEAPSCHIWPKQGFK